MAQWVSNPRLHDHEESALPLRYNRGLNPKYLGIENSTDKKDCFVSLKFRRGQNRRWRIARSRVQIPQEDI